MVVGQILNYDDYMKGLIALLMLVSLPLIAADTGYRIVHPDGTVEFTDDDTKGGEAIPLEEVPGYQSDGSASPAESPVNSEQSTSSQDPDKSEVVYESITVISPQQEETVWFDGSGVQVNVRVTPALAEGHQVVIYLDGSEAVRGAQTSLTIPRVFRGTHSLQAVIQDSSGSTRLSSPSVTFHMRQHSIN